MREGSGGGSRADNARGVSAIARPRPLEVGIGSLRTFRKESRAGLIRSTCSRAWTDHEADPQGVRRQDESAVDGTARRTRARTGSKSERGLGLLPRRNPPELSVDSEDILRRVRVLLLTLPHFSLCLSFLSPNKTPHFPILFNWSTSIASITLTQVSDSTPLCVD